MQNLSRDVTRLQRAKKQNRQHYFLNLSKTAERNLSQKLLSYLFRHSTMDLGFHKTGRDRVHRDFVSRQFSGGYFC